MAAVAEAILFMNPRRFIVVLLSRISFDIDSTEVFDETTSCIDDADNGATKAYDDGARIATAAHAVERKEVVLVMVAELETRVSVNPPNEDHNPFIQSTSLFP